jgi:hypothetical protein
MSFNPLEHLTKLSGKDYLAVAWRIAWFRDANPKGNIQTELIMFEPKVVFKATVWDNDGVMIASAYGSAPALDKGLNSWKGREIEKAETAAIGRALGSAGYGTQFTDDFDEDVNLADSPLEPKAPAKQAPKPPAPVATEGSVKIDKVTIRINKNNKPYIIAGGATFQTGQAFRDIDISTEGWKVAGEYMLPFPVWVNWEMNGEYKNGVSVHPDSVKYD